jgi:hypothetical protein
MKNLSDFIKESMLENVADNVNIINEESEIKSEKDFREYARKKFEEVFGDELDEDKMNETIEGILKDNAEAVEKGEWGELIGILNKGFVKED